ncbi:DUF2510 domain-containing protein [Streptomyces sp. CBG30]|uniref:DUF2510 domain-containing protein n=1 Tax=Streptomyces sp. CBG30 TaxID=2838869 RepID=UPI0035B3A7E7
MTPPGWHPDPGHSGKGPDQERWWDGVQWTGHVRPSPAAVRRRGPPYRRRCDRRAVVLAAIGGGMYLLGERDGDRQGIAARLTVRHPPPPREAPAHPTAVPSEAGAAAGTVATTAGTRTAARTAAAPRARTGSSRRRSRVTPRTWPPESACRCPRGGRAGRPRSAPG